MFHVVNFHELVFKESFVYFLEEVKTEDHCGREPIEVKPAEVKNLKRSKTVTTVLLPVFLMPIIPL